MPSDLDLAEMVADPGMAPREWQSKTPDFMFTGRKAAVTRTPDLVRVMALRAARNSIPNHLELSGSSSS